MTTGPPRCGRASRTAARGWPTCCCRPGRQRGRARPDGHRTQPAVVASRARGRAESGDAEDVLQTTWMRLVAHLGDIHDSTALTSWLVTTTKREAWRVSARDAGSFPLTRNHSPAARPGAWIGGAGHHRGPAARAVGGHRPAFQAVQELLRIIAFAPRPTTPRSRRPRDAGREHRPDARPLPGQAPRAPRQRLAGGRAVTPPDAGPLPSAGEPLDDVDFGVLDEIRELFEAADPMPADLPERIRFSLALRDLEVRSPGSPRRNSWPWRPGERS